jgi:hypothetical protein
MVVWWALSLKISATNGHYYQQRAVTPNQITQQNCLQRGRRALKAVKALRPDFHKTRIFKKPMSPKDTGRKL